MAAKVVPVPRRLSRTAALALVRKLAKNTVNIGWSEHALEMLMERGVTSRQALETIRSGRPVSDPSLDEYDEWRLKLVKRCAGRRVQVVVATNGKDSLSVVTII